jgi:hypothetical protein
LTQEPSRDTEHPNDRVTHEGRRVHWGESRRDHVTLTFLWSYEVEQVDDRIDRVENDETEYSTDDEEYTLSL